MLAPAEGIWYDTRVYMEVRAMGKTLLLAHRGFSGPYPENTPLAFRKAAEAGADGIESDVHMTRDGRLVIFHDDRVTRTSDGTGSIRDMTYDELRALDIGAWKGREFAGEHIWTLEQLLDFCAGAGLYLNLELKNDKTPYPGLEERVRDLLRGRGMQERVLVSSFNHGSMARFKALCPEVETGLLYSRPIRNTVRYASRSGADAMHPRCDILLRRPELVEQLHALGMKVNTWTADRPEDIGRLLAMGVDAVISDHPDRLLRAAGRRPES